jgi:hypothetical protein
MNDLLKIEVRNKVTGEIYTITGFHSSYNDTKNGVVQQVTAVGLRGVTNKGELRGITKGSKDWENFEVITPICELD